MKARILKCRANDPDVIGVVLFENRAFEVRSEIQEIWVVSVSDSLESMIVDQTLTKLVTVEF